MRSENKSVRRGNIGSGKKMSGHISDIKPFWVTAKSRV